MQAATTALQWRPLGDQNYVDYGVADSVLGPSDAGNEARPARSIPGCVLGPGHNCVILGPDRQTEYIVLPCLGYGGAADVLGQTDLDGGWPAAQDPPGRRKLVSRGDVKELMKLGCASTMSNGSAYSF